MKADAYGTMTEQERFGVGWKPFKKKERAEACIDCRHCRPTGIRTFTCTRFHFATARRSVCDGWKPKEGQHGRL